MKLRFFPILFSSVAIAAGTVVLVGFFIDLPYLTDLRQDFLRWGVLLTAVAIIVGVANLFQVHWHRIKTRQPGGGYSFLLILSLLITLIIAALLGPTAPTSQWLYDNVQVPIEVSLLGLMAVLLIYAATRMFNRRPSVFSLVFILTALLVLLGSVTLPKGISLPFITELRFWMDQVLVTSGARGILIGVGLGTIATGLRILLGVDRPYGG